MGLSSALATALSGLRANQAQLSIVSSNIANAQTPGYVAQNANQIEVASGGFGSTVEVTGVNPHWLSTGEGDRMLETTHDYRLETIGKPN